MGDVTLRIVRDWALRFDAQGPAGLARRKAPGAAPKPDDARRRALVEGVDKGPTPAIHGVVRWRLVDLAQWVWEEFRVAVSPRTPSRGLRGLGHRKLHARDPETPEAFKETSPPRWRRSPKGAPRAASGESCGSRDEMRVGQKNPITRRRARRGTRPAAPKHQRTASACLFGAIGPKEGKGAALVRPRCVTEAMSLQLAEISTAVAPDAPAVVLLDQAGWHQSRALAVPDNPALMPRPPCAPELNPAETIWQSMRENWLSSRTFEDDDDIVAHCRTAWNKLLAQPATIASIGMRDRAHGF